MKAAFPFNQALYFKPAANGSAAFFGGAAAWLAAVTVGLFL
jgi:hypothetical protein